jgi:hypothetical protein
MKELTTWSHDTDEHLIKFLPMQFAGLVYEILNLSTKNRDRLRMTDAIKQLYTLLESNLRGGDVGENLTFKKKEYKIPGSLFRLQRYRRENSNASRISRGSEMSTPRRKRDRDSINSLLRKKRIE